MFYLTRFLPFLFFAVSSILFAQVADHVVIAEVYGGGGNSGSYYKYDYIILYNPTAQSVDLSTWSIQYASATRSSWDVTKLSGSITANSYYAIQENAGSNGVDLPFLPNVVDSTSLSATAGKVALVNNQIALTGTMPIPNINVIDLVGYGNANGYEGTAPAPAPSNTKSIRRKDNNGNETYGINGNGCDADQNSTDFFTYAADGSVPPLPVELISFEAISKQQFIQLAWQTATEVNNYGFDIERASNSLNTFWQKIGFVKGSGNSNVKNVYFFEDKNIKLGEEYIYRLKQIDADGKYQYSNYLFAKCNLPDKIILAQNYPNPFNPFTKIKFILPQKNFVVLNVFNSLGQEIKTLFRGIKEAGEHEYEFLAESLPSGVYFIKLQINEIIFSKKMILLK